MTPPSSNTDGTRHAVYLPAPPKGRAISGLGAPRRHAHPGRGLLIKGLFRRPKHHRTGFCVGVGVPVVRLGLGVGLGWDVGLHAGSGSGSGRRFLTEHRESIPGPLSILESRVSKTQNPHQLRVPR